MKNSFNKFVFTVVLISFQFTYHAKATNWYVENGIYYVDQNHPNASDSNTGKESEPFLTIQHAADIVQPGETVIVKAGDYNEVIRTQRDGIADAYITLKAADGELVIVDRIVVGNSYHQFQGFNISPDLESTSIGIMLLEVSYIEISNNIIDMTGGSGIAIRSYDNVQDHVSIINNTFGPSEAKQNCLRIKGSNFKVSHNTFNYWGGSDVIVYLCRNSVISENVFNSISHKVGNYEHPDCIQVVPMANTSLDNTIIERNIFKNCAGQIIFTEHAEGQTLRNWTIRNNLFFNCGAKCLSVGDENTKIYNNTFYLSTVNGGHPMSIGPYGVNCQVKNNLFIGCGMNLSDKTQGFYHFRTATNIETFEVDYNYAAGAHPDYEAKSATDLYSAFIETHGVNGGDPKFVNVNIGWVWGDDNGDIANEGEYSGDASSIEVNTSEISRFIVGEFIEYSPFTKGADGIARQITEVDTINNIVRFTPEITDYAPPDTEIPKTNYDDNDVCNFSILLWGNKDWVPGDIIIPDFSLQSNSPAIDAGVNILDFSTDINGLSRPQGVAWDIGAYEYTTGTNILTALTENKEILQIYPNPFTNSATIEYTLPEGSDVEITLYDLTGRIIKHLCSGYQSSGIHTLNINAGDLSKGVYFCRIKTEIYDLTRKCIISE